MRSPYIVPGATRLTVTLAALPERFRPSDGRHHRVRRRVVGRQHRSRLALERRRQLDVDLGNDVRREAPELREHTERDVAVRADGRHRGGVQTGAERARPCRRRRELRQARADVAVVGDGLTRARAADER